MKINSKTWIEDEEGSYLFGFGIAAILEGIEKHGSISAVATDRGRSYRYVWGRIRKAEEALGTKLVETTLGGRSARRAELTEEGRRWMRGFHEVRKAVKRAATRSYDKHFGDL